MTYRLTEGAIERIVKGEACEKPNLQVISSKKISSQGADRYRLLLSDGRQSYSHAMLATQMNELMETGEMDDLCVVCVLKHLCNTIQQNRRVLVLLEVQVIAKGSVVQHRLGNPQPYKPGETTSSVPVPEKPEITTNGAKASHQPLAKPTPSVYSKPNVTAAAAATGTGSSSYSIKSSTPTTPTGGRVHSIASLTPYQNRWRIRARVTQKSNIRTWSNSRGEGRLFSVNLVDESGEIRATGFTDAVEKFYNLLEVNKVFYISRATLKTANKQYSTVKNDYEMTFNNDTCIEPCEDDADLPTMTFNFVKINELEKTQPNGLVDVIGALRQCGDVSTVIGKQSQREITKREIQLVDQSGMVVALTLWGKDAENFDGNGNPVLAVKGARVSDWGGRSLSVLASSQLIINPDIREAHLLRGWYDKEGSNMDFTGFKSEMGSGASGGGTNWKFFSQVKSENLGQGDKADYFTSKGTVIFLRKENCMYQACPTETCNKKVIDQGNGMFRCEKCNREFPDFKWRMILSVNLADFSDNQWVTCFQESAETILGKTAAELGQLRDSNEAAFDQVFQDALFKSFIIKLRAKVETYNDESRLKTVCTTANPIDWQEHGRRLVDDINKMSVA
ncbi:hypothetical protein CHS0354_029562 [Potamilus streckersoni]|uniref:Replication protein A subunit n=1 Tax=Potamilus streckersoni TaxID=2493646 RepID=A0AAE0RUE3_9BIVA|nr:hypothetical protein CHS0354_029562 [Potamilus streckersoni]